jgi:hypothetical protein
MTAMQITAREVVITKTMTTIMHATGIEIQTP